MYLFGILCLVMATAALPVLPDPPKLPNSAARKDSKIHTYNQNGASAAAPSRDEKGNKEVKIAPVVIPPPPQLPPFDYSILKKQKADQKQKYEDSVKQKAENYRKQKESVNPEKPLKDEVTPNPETVSEARENKPIVTSDSAPVADNGDNETVKNNITKIPLISIPPPPELPPFDYSILRKQKSDEKQKYEDSEKQKDENSKKEKEPVNPENPLNDEVTPNPEILSDSKTGLPDSEVHANNPTITSDSAPVADKKDNETVKNNIAKIPLISIPPPPELPPFDYSILRKQKSDEKQKYEDSEKQKDEKYKKEKEPVNPENPIKDEVTPNPETVSEARENKPIVTSDSAPVADNGDNETVKNNITKIPLISIPPPPELPPFDYSILRKQKSDEKQKYEDSEKQKDENSKKEKEPVNPENPLNDEVTPNPEILSDSKTGLPDSEVHANNPTITSDSAPVADKKDNETVKNNIAKIPLISIPPPPELPPFDYSILRKQKSDEKQKYEDSEKQKDENYKKEKEPVNPENPIKDEVTPNPETVSEVRENKPIVTSDSAPVADNKDNETVKNNIAKIPSISVPPPPELPPFDYSILRKQKSDEKQKYEDSVKQKDENSKKEKDPVNPEKPLKDEVTPNPETVSEARENKPIVTSDSAPVADNGDNETVKNNITKIPSISIPPPPELPPFDYSILRKQKSDEKQKYEDSVKQKDENSKKEKDPVNPEKPLNDEVTPNPETVSKVLENKPIVTSDSAPVADNKDNETVKNNVAKIPSISVPPPPELPPFDYSSLKKQKAEKSKKDKEVLVTEKPVEINVEEPKPVGDSKPITEPESVEETKPKEELNKEPVKHSEDLPVARKVTIPPAPFLSKLISNYPESSFGRNWSLQKPSKSRPPRIIYPKFNGIVHTN